MKPYGLVHKNKRYLFALVILVFGMLYAAYLSYLGIKTTMVKQVRLYLTAQMQQAQQSVFPPESEQVLVRLRRDQYDSITAVTVDGILLNQLQIEYQKALTNKDNAFILELSTADIFGSKFLFWVPGKWQLSCYPDATWSAIIKSRTLEQLSGVKVFQLVLTTKCSAKWYAFFHTTMQEEVLLYESIIYTPSR